MSNRRLRLKKQYSCLDEALNRLKLTEQKTDLENIVAFIESNLPARSDVYFFVSDFVPQISTLMGVDDKFAFILLKELTEIFSDFDFVSVLPTESFPWLQDIQALIDLTPEDIEEVRETNVLSRIAGIPRRIEDASDYLRFAFKAANSVENAQ